MIESPRSASALMRPTPTTAGTSSARATMAVCEVLVPASVTKAATLRSCRSSTVSAGERSWAMMTAPSGGASCTSTASPIRFLMMRSPTYSTSERRSLKYSSATSANALLILRTARLTAHSAFT